MRQNGVHLHIVVTALAQDVHHLAHRILALAVGPLRDAHHSLVVGLAPFGLATRNDDVVGKHIGLRHEIGYVSVHLQPAHKGVFGTVEHLYHLRLLDVILAAGHKGNLHPAPLSAPIELRSDTKMGLSLPSGMKEFCRSACAQTAPPALVPSR